VNAGYSLRQNAQEDLESIWLYSFQEWGIEQADSYIRTLLSRFTWLAENPQLGQSRPDVKPGYYSYPEGMHMVFYVIAKTGIDIIGIPHQNMDIVRHFDD